MTLFALGWTFGSIVTLLAVVVFACCKVASDYDDSLPSLGEEP